ncbi:Voltage-dependent L-type calcium channel subunit beta-2 [Dissostichus eleginoides]|uniref:Voltage-dependent L-type calcium channel subunit beta-2 n=1 Tax=Dissostichus eleginoides TaxID=100907 RepID=A0AAD9BJV2_DISEL|nr:Voltage-dependent L-type calcium channel subunit beta-2 [Dissostichus eleginoides]
MVVNNTPKTRAATPLDYRMDSLEHPMLQSQSKGGRRKGRFKGSDGSTSSDTTTNSLVRQMGIRALPQSSSSIRDEMCIAVKGLCKHCWVQYVKWRPLSVLHLQQ